MCIRDSVSINLFSASFNPNPALQFTVGSGPVTILYVYLATSTATGGGGSGDSGAVIDAFNQSIGALVDNDFVTVSPDNAAHSITDEANVDGWVDTEDSGYTIIADSPNIGPYQSLPTNAVFVNWVVIVGGIPPGVVITNANLVVPEGVTVYALAIYYNPPKPSKEVYPDKTQHVLEKLPMQDLKNEMLDKVAQDNSKSQTLHEKTTDKIYVGEFGGKMGDGNPNMPEAIAVHLSSLSQKISDLESRLSTALKGDVYKRQILTYALCTGLCAAAQTWWQLMLFRFLSALGIGGEWAVGAALLAETWPSAWRPWLSAVLQTAVNLGILVAASFVTLLSFLPHPPPERWVFLIGVVPALLVFWIRRQVPESDAWRRAESESAAKPKLRDLFRGRVAPVTWHTSAVCALGLSGRCV